MLAEFARTYRLDDAAVVAALTPWRVRDVATSPIRSALDVALVTDDGAQLTVAIEPRGATPHLAATRDLQLSYYSEPGIDHGRAAAVVRALAAALAQFERGAAPRSLPVVPSHGHRFVELRVNRDCNERCRFCNTPADSPTIEDAPDAVLARIAAAAAGGCTDLLLTGRETTLTPELPRYIAAARAAGIANVRVQTNATTLGHGPMLARLVDAGVTEFEVSLHTLDPDGFAAVIGPATLLAHATAGLDALSRYPALGVTIVCVITAINLDEVPTLVATIAARWPTVRALVLSPVAPVGDGEAALDLLVPYPRLGPVVAAALRVAAAHGLRASVPARCGLPPCLLPADLRDRHDAVRSERGGPIEPGKRKPSACATCALDRRCAGAWSRYLELHGDAGLAPIPLAAS